jgi:O-antigen ligase
MFKQNLSNISAYHISLICLGLMFLVPFVITHHEQPLTSFYPEWIAAAMGLVATFPLLSMLSWRNMQSGLKIPQVAFIFLGLVAILCVQWALGMLHSKQYALSVLSYFIWAFLLVVLGSYLRRELGWEKLVNALAWCLVVAGIINVCIVILQFVTKTGGVIPFLPNLPSYGALSQPNHFANFCALATSSLIYLFAKERFSIGFFTLLFVGFIAMMSLSGSRSTWLYLTVMTTLLVLTHKHNSKYANNSKATYRAYRAGLFLIPLFVLIQLVLHYLIPNEFVNLPTERLIDGVTASTSSLRMQFWYDSLRIFLQSPWLGVGAGKLITNTFLILDTPTTMASNRVFEHAHNLFLHLLAEMGIGAVIVVFIGLWIWLKSFKWREISLETCWLLSLIAVLSIHSMLEYPLWFAFFLGIAAVLLGAGDEKLVTIKLSKIRSKISYYVLVVLLILGTMNLATSFIANRKLESWLNYLVYENINIQENLNWVRRYSLLSPYAELMYAMTTKININNIDNLTKVNQSVMSFRPYQTIAYNQALLLKHLGDDTNAKKQLSRALIAYPKKFNIALENTPLKYKQLLIDLLAETRAEKQN